MVQEKMWSQTSIVWVIVKFKQNIDSILKLIEIYSNSMSETDLKSKLNQLTEAH
jgi:hypothetical protein